MRRRHDVTTWRSRCIVEDSVRELGYAINLTAANEMARLPPVRVFCRCFPLVLVLWVCFVLYPNPLGLARSIRRLATPSVDPAAVESLAATLPSDPAAIEEGVLQSLPYRYDWQLYGMPWYFPTVDEALNKSAGDCKARAIVLASVLEAKGIPYQIRSSPIHVWVEYEGKAASPLEDPGAGFYQVNPGTQTRSLRLPTISLGEFASTTWQGFWPPMPFARKTILLSGLALLLAVRIAWPRLKRQATDVTVDSAVISTTPDAAQEGLAD